VPNIIRSEVWKTIGYEKVLWSFLETNNRSRVHRNWEIY